MSSIRSDSIAVIFVSQRTERDEAGYSAAALAMEAEAARQPGYLGLHSVRDAAGQGITISYWEDEACALAWRDHAGHAAIRAQGRARWYKSYELIVTSVIRAHSWPA